MSLESNLLGALRTNVTNSAANLVTGAVGNITNANKTRTGGLQSFISQMNGNAGMYRGTFFEVSFYNMDAGKLNSNTSMGNSDVALTLLCHTSSIPGVKLETTPNTIYSLKYETPIGVEFDPLFCTAYIDNNFQAHNALYNDMLRNRINTKSFSPRYRDPQTLMKVVVTLFTTAPAGILGGVVDSLVGKKDKSGLPKTSHDGLPVACTFVLSNCFVKQVQQTPLDWGAENHVSSVTFEISYEWFDVVIPGGIGADQPLDLGAIGPAINAATVFTKYPILGTAYDAAKRSLIGSQQILQNPILNQGSQFIP